MLICLLLLFWLKRQKKTILNQVRGIITYSHLLISLCEASGMGISMVPPLVTWLCYQQVKTVNSLCHATFYRSDSWWDRIPDCSFAQVRALTMPERKTVCKQGQCGFIFTALFFYIVYTQRPLYSSLSYVGTKLTVIFESWHAVAHMTDRGPQAPLMSFQNTVLV